MKPMKMDGQTVQVRDVETIAHTKGRLISVSYEQRRRDGDQEQRKREIYDNGKLSRYSSLRCRPADRTAHAATTNTGISPGRPRASRGGVCRKARW